MVEGLGRLDGMSRRKGRGAVAYRQIRLECCPCSSASSVKKWSGSELIKEWEELCLASSFLLVRCCGAKNELRAQMPRQKRKQIELLKQKVSYGAAEVGAGEHDRSVRQVDVGKMSKL